ncbi:MAG: DUF2855 family protein [Bacteroidota bacterium]
MNKTLLVHKNEINKIKLNESPIPEIQDGEVLLRIEKFAMTTNNITYAVVGHRIGYWNFFPAEEPFGIVPVWGYASVVESKHDGVGVGERVYGYFPMGNFLKVKVGKNNPFGFVDVAEHRVKLPKIYNFYPKVKNDMAYDASTENYAPIFRPLFTTSFLNYHFLKENNFFGAEQILITSASSKTGLGLGYLLHHNQATDGKKVIGLTSSRNVDFVKGAGYYDQVISYGDLEKELPNNASTIVDMAGNSKLLHRAHQYLGDHLKFVSLIGIADWSAEKEFRSIPNSNFFFAPAFAQIIYEKWGVEKANQVIAEEFANFTKDASSWVTLEEINSMEALSKLYLQLLGGKVDPSKGYLFLSEE